MLVSSGYETTSVSGRRDRTIVVLQARRDSALIPFELALDAQLHHRDRLRESLQDIVGKVVQLSTMNLFVVVPREAQLTILSTVGSSVSVVDS